MIRLMEFEIITFLLESWKINNQRNNVLRLKLYNNAILK